jgi:hypothetical protein
MKYKLIKLPQLSGKKASIYTLFNVNMQKTTFDIFYEKHVDSFKDEIIDIILRLQSIGDLGALDYFFKNKEGTLGDGVCALYDKPSSNLRLYCIRFGSDILILGGGGYKSKKIKALQEDESLTKENYLMRFISKEISKRIMAREITFSKDNLDFQGPLEFYTSEKN